MNAKKNMKKSMKKMKNTDEEYECMQREYVGKTFKWKVKVKKWRLFIGKNYGGQKGYVASYFHTLGNVKV